jgi:hypothetical protein
MNGTIGTSERSNASVRRTACGACLLLFGNPNDIMVRH